MTEEHIKELGFNLNSTDPLHKSETMKQEVMEFTEEEIGVCMEALGIGDLPVSGNAMVKNVLDNPRFTEICVINDIEPRVFAAKLRSASAVEKDMLRNKIVHARYS